MNYFQWEKKKIIVIAEILSSKIKKQKYYWIKTHYTDFTEN